MSAVILLEHILNHLQMNLIGMKQEHVVGMSDTAVEKPKRGKKQKAVSRKLL